MRRRRFLRTASALAVVSAGVASAEMETERNAVANRQDSGLVWSSRDRQIGTQHLFDVARGVDYPFLVCGYGGDGDDQQPLVRVTDRWGRQESQRRGPQWGDQGHVLLALDDGYLLAGVDGGEPMLAAFTDLSNRSWRRTYDGTPDGQVRAMTTGDGHAVGWNQSDESAGPVVVGTDETGAERWTDHLPAGRSLSDVVSAGPDPGTVVVIGTATADDAPAWATVWQPDGTRTRDLVLDTPGDGPEAAVEDENGVVLAGTTDDGWWLQKQAVDWSVTWTRRYAADGSDRGVDDLVSRVDRYGLLGHDRNGAVVVRTDGHGGEQWRGRYAPYTDGDGPADRGHALLPVAGDEFVIAGDTAPGEEGRDWWLARVGEPGVATPAAVPEPTPTRPPTTFPPTTAPPTDSMSKTATPEPTGETTSEPSQSTDLPGFGVLAAATGLSGWLAFRTRGD